MNAQAPEPSNVEVYRASTDAADLCKDIVVASAMEIQKRKYVKVEGWQAIALAHGCAAGSRDVERIDGGVRAIGEVRRLSDGQVIATAEGFVGEDEPTWYGGPMRKWKWGEKRGEKVWYEEEMPKRADYAIRAMAQTRAISRACRSAFAHVVVMMNAGLSTTPAEEVPDGGFDDRGAREDAPREREEPETSGDRRQSLAVVAAQTAINMCNSLPELKAWKKANAAAVDQMPRSDAEEVVAFYKERAAALTEPEPEAAPGIRQTTGPSTPFDDEIPF